MINADDAAKKIEKLDELTAKVLLVRICNLWWRWAEEDIRGTDAMSEIERNFDEVLK